MDHRPLRIAHIDTERTWRGGEQQVFSLAKGLGRKGHPNLVVAERGGVLACRLKRLADLVRVVEVNYWGEWDILAARAVRKEFLQEKVDIVHAHTAHGVALAALATYKTDIPFVSTRRVDFHLSRNPFSRWKNNRAAHHIAISDRVRDVLIEDRIPSEKISVIKSGVDFDRYSGTAPVPRGELNLPSDAVIVGQVAALTSEKDQQTFIRAIALMKKSIPNLRALIVGEGPMRGELEDLVRELNLQDIVRLTGFREDSLQLLRSFDLFCLSSQEEGLGTSILDAMALGIPVVATRAGGIPEMVHDGVTGYLANPHDPGDLAKALIQAVRCKDKSLCARAFKMAQDYDIKNTISKTENLYRSVLRDQARVHDTIPGTGISKTSARA